MGIYESRWNNAKRIAKHINRLLKQNYRIFREDGSQFEGFSIDESLGEIIEPLDECSSMTWFINNPEWDNGSFTTIEEYNKQFEGWTYIKPSDIHKLQLA